MLKIQKAGLGADFRASILRSTALAALMAVGVFDTPPAFGQAQSSGNQAGSGEQVEQVVVTGTAIVRNGYSAPTPLTVVSPEQLETSTTGNVADYVNTIPSFYGSATPDTSAHSSSSAQAGLNVLNLRDLGSVRTLVLIDGQRSVGSTTTGLVDINNIPQDLVTRVDIVTGGASAVYGSDAVAGVVNFVLDKTFEGTKGEISGGLTTYGDDWNWRLRLTEGLGFDGDRIHLIVSGEITDDAGVKGVPRAWNNTGAEIINNPAYTKTNGLPQLLSVNHAAVYTAAYGGVIDSGPAAQTTFAPNGQPITYNLGPTVSNPYTVGGDWAAYQANYTSLDPQQDAQRLFTRASYDITDDVTVFGQYSYSSFHSFGVNEPVFYLGNLTLQANNAYLPASIASLYAADHISSFTFGTLNGGLPPWSDNTYRTTARYVAGADGKFDAIGSTWTWGGYFQEGDTYSEFNAEGVPLVANYMKAIQAVTNPATGQIVCASSLTTPGNGCVPLDLFGTGGASPAAINYVEGQGITPTQHLHLQEDVWSGQITGEPFSDWAGPVSIAAGVQHRREYLHTTADSIGPTGGWYGANYIPVTGAYNVTEGFVETVVPLAKDEIWAKELDLNAAVRATDYSTSGYVTTYKVGATWDVIPDIRIRATRSRDIRAPNLSELFQSGAGGTQSLIDDFHGRGPVLNTGLAIGNLGLKPETADNTGVGAVVEPTFLPGLSTSVDYWQINISNAITSLSGQNTIDLCYEGIQLYCSRITPNLATLAATPITGVQIVTEPSNFAEQTEEGIDFEASYHFNLADVVTGWPGSFSIRYLGTHYITNLTNDNGLVPNVQIVGSTIPKWINNITATYTGDPWSISLIGHLISAGVINDNYVQCSSGCPLSTTNNPTINNDIEPGAFYLDTALNYNVGSAFQVYLNIANVFNTNPAIIPQGPSGIPYENIQTNTSLYEILGRTFRLGVRFNM